MATMISTHHHPHQEDSGAAAGAAKQAANISHSARVFLATSLLGGANANAGERRAETSFFRQSKKTGRQAGGGTAAVKLTSKRRPCDEAVVACSNDSPQR